MKRRNAIFLLPLAAGLPAPASAQQVQERVDNGQRVCVYTGARGTLSSNDVATVVPAGAGTTCPLAPPGPRDGVPPPPTASLISQDVSAQGRTCVYAQLDDRWSFTVPLSQSCPPAAGMVKTARSGAN